MHTQSIAFEPPVGVGPALEDASATVTSPYGNMPDKFGPVLGAVDTVVTKGRTIWSFTVKGSNATGNVVVGVADASVGLTPKSGPACTGFHLGKSKVVHSKNAHKISGGGRLLSEDTPRKIGGSAPTITIFVIADMDRRRLSFAVGTQTPVDCGVRLPACGVRPYVWLGGPGVGSVSLAECFLDPPSNASTPTSQGTPSFSSNRIPVGGRDEDSFDTFETEELAQEAPATAELNSEATAPPPTAKALNLNTVVTGEATANEDVAAKQWTERGASWFSPLQALFGGGDEKKEEVAEAPPVTRAVQVM